MDLSIREITEKNEEILLSVHAQSSKDSLGRFVNEDECRIRTMYQRDRDRIIHCKSFRSLKGKTQVFIVKNDFFRTRLTHTLEVNQVSRTIARALRLNEDLVEAIALGHDLGHACFGHRSEGVLHRLSGKFKHNEQSLRVVDVLERDGRGLNLTYEVRDGILNHTGPNIPITMEGKLVRIVDRITYLCHDIQDSINAGIIKHEDLPIELIAALGETHGERVNTFVMDIIDETIKCLNLNNEVKIYQSPKMKQNTDLLRSFMFKNVYYGERCASEEKKAEFIVESLYNHYFENPKELPTSIYNSIEKEGLNRCVTDFIAMCTDTYAIEIFKEKFLPFKK